MRLFYDITSEGLIYGGAIVLSFAILVLLGVSGITFPFVAWTFFVFLIGYSAGHTRRYLA